MKKSLTGMEKYTIETHLEADTKIQEKSKSQINPSTIGIHPISTINKEKAKKKMLQKQKKAKK